MKARSIICIYVTTNPENVVKIGLVHSEIISYKGPLKRRRRRNSSITYSPPRRQASPSLGVVKHTSAAGRRIDVDGYN